MLKEGTDVSDTDKTVNIKWLSDNGKPFSSWCKRIIDDGKVLPQLDLLLLGA